MSDELRPSGPTGAPAGQRPRPAVRPWQVTAAAALVAGWWLGGLTLMALGARGDGLAAGDTVFVVLGLGFWTTVVALMLRRLLRGGPVVHWALLRLCLAFGLLPLVAVGAFGASPISSGHLGDVLIPTGMSVGLLVAVALLNSAAARAWCAGPNPGDLRRRRGPRQR